MSSCRVYGIVIHRWLHVRTNITEPSNFAQLARTRSLCSRVFRAHVSSKGSRVHMPTSVCYPYLSLGGKDDCFRVLDSHIPTEKPQLRLLFSPFSITMATATPTSKTMATYTPTCISTTTALTYKGCPAPTPLPTEMETSSVLKKRRRKMNQHKYKKWRKKHRFLRRRLKK